MSVEVVAADAPFLADLVGLQVAAPDPIANGLLPDLQAGGDQLNQAGASDSLSDLVAAYAAVGEASGALADALEAAGE